MNFYENRLLLKNYNNFVKFLQILLIDYFPLDKQHPFYNQIIDFNAFFKSHHSFGNKNYLFNEINLFHHLQKFNLNNFIGLTSLRLLNTYIKILNERSIILVNKFFSEDFIISYDFIPFFKSINGLASYVIGFKAIYNSMLNSVCAIEVKRPSGKIQLGSGFIFGYIDKEKLIYLVITNKHVLQDAKLMNVILPNSKIIKTRNLYLSHKEIDLACIEIDLDEFNGAFQSCDFYFDQLNIMNEVMTIGYPYLPNTNEPIPLAHNGQINGTAKVRNSEIEYLVFSAKTSPGNSGGPIINELGKVIGIVTESGESKDLGEDGKENFERFFYGISSQHIISFINDDVIPRLRKL